MRLKITILLCLSFLSLVAVAEVQIPKMLKILLHAEFHLNSANDPNARKPQEFWAEHYEVPLSLVNADLASYMTESLKQSLIFEKNGIQFVRWLINPEDIDQKANSFSIEKISHHKKVAEFLKRNGYDSAKKTYFKAYLTASRSIILIDPNNGSIFSIKVSTNSTGGQWRDKAVNEEQVTKARLLSDTLTATQVTRPFKSTLVLQESAGFVIAEIDQGMLIREIEPLLNSGKIYLPLFSILHNKEGKRIAALNGSENPELFWRGKIPTSLGKSFAELSANGRIQYQSVTSQQFLYEFNDDFSTTGLVVARDPADSTIFESVYGEKFIEAWKSKGDQESFVLNEIRIRFGPFHGMNIPEWLGATKNRLESWGNELGIWEKLFFETFEKEFSTLTNIPYDSLENASKTGSPVAVIEKIYNLNETWTPYINGWKSHPLYDPIQMSKSIPCKIVLEN